MCGDCWNAAMGAPAAVVAARFAWVGYRDRIPFLKGRDAPPAEPSDGPRVEAEPIEAAPVEPELVDAGPPPP